MILPYEQDLTRGSSALSKKKKKNNNPVNVNAVITQYTSLFFENSDLHIH